MDIIQARLENISTANGYHTDPKKIERGKLTPFHGYDLPGINFWPVRMESTRVRHRQDRRTLSVMIEIFDKTRDKAFSDQADILAQDAVTALNRAGAAAGTDDPPSHALGGAVSDLRFQGYGYHIGEGQAPWLGVLIEILVVFRCDVNDMEGFRP